MGGVTESTVEEAALSWFGELGYAVAHGAVIVPGELGTERDSFGDVVFACRLRDAIDRLNPEISAEAREEAFRKVLRPDSPSLVGNNRAFHAMLRDGVEVEYRSGDGTIRGDRVWLLDCDQPARNDWLAVNQFAVIERHHRFKEDAPSGTALKFGQLIAAAMGQTVHRHGRQGRPGIRPHEEIGYHAIRSGDNPGEHTIVFAMLGESIELSVRATNRDCYALGALSAAKFLAGRPVGLYSISDVLGL